MLHKICVSGPVEGVLLLHCFVLLVSNGFAHEAFFACTHFVCSHVLAIVPAAMGMMTHDMSCFSIALGCQWVMQSL